MSNWLADYHHLLLVRLLLLVLVFGVVWLAASLLAARRSRRTASLLWRVDRGGYRWRRRMPWQGRAIE